MNLKTTLLLVLLVVAGGLSWLGYAYLKPKTVTSETLAVLEQALTPESLTRIEVAHGDKHVVLERAPGQDWTLPGKWPARPREVEQLVGLVTGLRSRFAPLAVDDAGLASYGLDKPPVTVTVRGRDGKEHVLQLGEEPPGASNRFSRPTYLRLEGKHEVIRLAPGLVAALDRPLDYYRSRWLFPYRHRQDRLVPSEQQVKEGDAPDKTEALTVKALTVKGPQDKEKKESAPDYTLTWQDDDWRLDYPVAERPDPVRDLPDPDKLKTVLAAVPDIWAEQFVEKPEADLAAYGLKDPEQTLRITRGNGETVTLLIGKQSQVKKRKVMRPPPPGMPIPPQEDTVEEAYRFAKLQDNDQVFEIKADKLKDVFVAAETLRDARLARFRTEDARRVELTLPDRHIVLVKEKDRWQLEQPLKADAEMTKVNELLDKLSGLQASGSDVLDKKIEPETHGLDKPAATVKVTVEESKGEGSAKTQKTKTFTLALGKQEKAKLSVRVEGRDRINTVEDSLLKLVQQPALAFRGRRLFDFTSTDVAKVEVQRGGEPVVLEQAKTVWRLTTPVQAEVDPIKAGQLVGDLSRLEAVEFVTEEAKPEDLDGVYGLAKPALTAKITLADANKPAPTLLLGKQRDGKPEYFAKLESAPGVFVVKKEIRDTLDQDSLAYRPLQLWQVQPDDVAELRIGKGADEYSLKRDGPAWRITGPFEAAALPDLAKPMLDELATLRGERYTAHVAKDLAAYGLDKPYLRLALTTAPKKEGDAAQEDKKERVLLIGQPTEKDAKTRFAKLGDGEAVFVVGEKVLAAVDRGALDLLDRGLLSLDAKAIERVRSEGPSGPLTVQRQGDEWRVTEAPAAPFPADSQVMAGVLGVWSGLRVQRFAAYGSKADLAAYGLDKPAATMTVTLKPPAADDKDAKPVEHTVALGKPVEGAVGERYVRIDNGPGVAVLAANVVNELTRGHLDFVDRTVLKLDAAEVAGLHRRAGNDDLEVVQRNGGWQLVKPAEARADDPTVEALVSQLASLRAKRVAAYPAKDFKPFGLEEPAAVVKVRLKGAPETTAERVLRIGQVAEEATGDRFAVVDGSTAVVVLPGALARRLLAPPLQFRDRNLARFTDADRITLERGARKAVFAKVDGTWKLTAPLDAPAEQTDLEDFLGGVANLRADELVADKPADLKPYGLDRPEAQWRFQAGDKEVLSLLIGNQEKEGPRCFAKLASGDLVFLLDPQLTTKALAEYRSRTLWAPLDAVQIDRLSYGYARNPFALEKVGETWQVVGRPELKVPAEAVRETLDALAGLRVGRYVADKGADLKLYGLEPPQLTLEIQTRSGQRVLHVGRPEGESKRLYARVPEGERTDVFVIDETDANRIVRPLATFTQGAEKVAP
jgi:hypothetical protein